MADGVTVRIDGIQDLKIAIEDLTQDMRKKVVRAGLRAEALPMVREARQSAPVLKKQSKYRTPGLLRRSINVFNSKQNNGRNGVLGVYIGVRGPTKFKKLAASIGGKGSRNPFDPFYWWWQEFGFTATGRKTIRGGARLRERRRTEGIKRGTFRAIPGKRFMRDAFDNQKDDAVSIFQSKIKARIDKANTRK